MMKIGVLKKGDQVLNVTPEFIAVQRKNGEVDIIPLAEKNGLKIGKSHISQYVNFSKSIK